MMKKFLKSLGIEVDASTTATASELHKPYPESNFNFLYNLLFCDDLALFKNKNNTKGDGIWPTLLADKPDFNALHKIAEDEKNEGRVRAIAFNRLRASGQKVPAKKLLGVIVEVPQGGGLDVLATFAEGGVHYLNHSSKVAIFEGAGHPVEKLAKELIAMSEPIVNQIGPWDKKRLPPPKQGNVRMSFIVSDGLYFGEGPFDALQKDPMGGPVLAKAAELLQRVVDSATKAE